MTKIPNPHAVDFELDSQGRQWIGYAAGLAWRDDQGEWRRLEAPLRDVRSFAFRGQDEIWVAHRAKGYFSRIRKGQVTRLTSEQGYGPNQTFFLKTDRRGWIWRGTTAGVYVSDGVHTEPADWLILPVGGEAQQYGFFEDRDGSIWIATDKTVTHLSPDGAWFQPRAGMPVAMGALPAVLDPAPRHVNIEFSTLHATPFRPQPFQYRLVPRFTDWRAAPDGRIRISDLTTGEYRLEVRQAGLAATWVHAFRVGPAPWTRWWWTPLPLLAVWAVYQRDLISYRLRKWWFLMTRVAARGEPLDLTGEVLRGRFRLERLLSRGGFSQVYAGVDELRGGAVAVKILDQRSGGTAWVRARFAQEVTALYSVRHPGVVGILDSWILETGQPCLAMPLVEGATLREARPADLRRFVLELGEALAAVHRAGIVHRDVKPENLILRPDGSLVLIDFGVSGLLGMKEEQGVTRLLAGSVGYLAPERVTGEYSRASDLYACAAILRELGIDNAAVRAGLEPLPDRRPADVLEWSRQVAAEL